MGDCQKSFVQIAFVPPEFSIGMIALWYDSIESIPDGWHLCDGLGGTINLRDTFVVAAAGSYAPGATGGLVVHGHGFTSDGHLHLIDAGIGIALGAGYAALTSSEVETDSPIEAPQRPPYIALAYIQKVA